MPTAVPPRPAARPAALLCRASSLLLLLVLLDIGATGSESSPSRTDAAANSSPVIGILTQDWDANHTYMAASCASPRPRHAHVHV
jgi:hypothetical protein